jgi:hypothetical protein
MAYWTVEGCGGGRIGCLSKALRAAQKAAQRLRRPVKVTYHGPRPRMVNSLAQAHFKVDARGRRDTSIDPLWHSNVRKRKARK